MTTDRIVMLLGAALVIGWMLLARRGDLNGADARQLVAGGARLVDVRTREEFAQGHLSAAINIPVQELGGRMAELEPRDRPVVVYCQSGMRSRTAARTLRSGGFSLVRDLGAMSRW